MPKLTEAVGAELAATGQHKQQVIQLCQNEINAEFAQYSKPESKLMSKFRLFYEEQPKSKHYQNLVPAKLDTDLGYTLPPSCPQRVSSVGRLSEEQKRDKKRIKNWMGAKVVRTLQFLFWEKFDMLTNIYNMKALTRQIDMYTIWEDCLNFIVKEHKFIPESNLFYLKDDQVMLVELFRLYYMHYVNTQLARLAALGRHYAASAELQ